MLPLLDPTLLKQQCLIDGQWLDADDSAVLTVHNPANGAVIATVPLRHRGTGNRDGQRHPVRPGRVFLQQRSGPGMAREGSRYGMDDYLDVKYLCMGI